MLYFPNMDKQKKTPDENDDSDYDDEDEVVEYNQENYTPFLVKLGLCEGGTYNIALYQR